MNAVVSPSRDGGTVLSRATASASGTSPISVPCNATICPTCPSWAAIVACNPKRVASTRSNEVGVPPRCTWPRTVVRTSLPVRRSSSSPSCWATPVNRRWPNSSSPPSRSGIVPGLGVAPSLITPMTCRWPRSNRAVTISQTASMSKGSSGVITRCAPAAIPEFSAIQPACRPITSTSSTRWWDSAVVCSRSIISVAMLTAVSKPKVRSVPSMSLSIVFGTPTTGTPSEESQAAAVSVPSPPMGTSTSTPWASSTSRIRPSPACSFSGATRAEPRIVPPRVSRLWTMGRSRGMASSSSRPRQPLRNPTTSLPYCFSAVRTTARRTALRPGQSPPPVRTPMRTCSPPDGGIGRIDRTS